MDVLIAEYGKGFNGRYLEKLWSFDRRTLKLLIISSVKYLIIIGGPGIGYMWKKVFYKDFSIIQLQESLVIIINRDVSTINFERSKKEVKILQFGEVNATRKLYYELCSKIRHFAPILKRPIKGLNESTLINGFRIWCFYSWNTSTIDLGKRKKAQEKAWRWLESKQFKF